MNKSNLMEKQFKKIVFRFLRSFESKISPWRIINVDTSFRQYNQFWSWTTLLGVDRYPGRVEVSKGTCDKYWLHSLFNPRLVCSVGTIRAKDPQPSSYDPFPSISQTYLKSSAQSIPWLSFESPRKWVNPDAKWWTTSTRTHFIEISWDFFPVLPNDAIMFGFNVPIFYFLPCTAPFFNKFRFGSSDRFMIAH